MIRETGTRCSVCGWELFAHTWIENHGEPWCELYCRNGCEFDIDKEYTENAEEN